MNTTSIDTMSLELTLLQFTSQRFGGVSTSIKSLLMQYLDVQELTVQPFSLVGFRITTQTLVLQLESVNFIFRDRNQTQKTNFNAQPIEYREFNDTIQVMARVGKLDSHIRAIHTRCFSIYPQSGQGKVSIEPSTVTRMNSSIVFELESRKDPKKVYKILVFSNGMVKIAGVNECYKMSEVPLMIQSVMDVLTNVLIPAVQIRCERVQVAMCNYVCEFPLIASLIDIPRFYKHFTKTPEAVYKLAQTHSLEIVSLKMPKVRNVIYLKTGLAKATEGLNRQAITFQITCSGKVIIQGATGHFSTTSAIIDRFTQLASDLFTSYIVSK